MAFLLFGDQHSHAAYILQRLLALARAPATEQQHSDLLRQYAQTNPQFWRGYLVEALCIINARQALRKLGLVWTELRLHYLPQVQEITLHVHPLLKALYLVCEQLSVAQSGRLVLDINDKLAARQAAAGAVLDEPLRFFDYAYLEIFMLDWLTRRHLRLGDINAVGSDLQLLIEYLKFNDFHALARLLIQTYNSNATATTITTTVGQTTELPPLPPSKFEQDDAGAAASPSAQSNRSVGRTNGCLDELHVRRQHAGFLLIINQFTFHQDVSDDLKVSWFN